MRRFLRHRPRIALRLTLIVSCGLAAVISALGVRLVRTEARELRTAVENELLVLTRSVHVAFENAIRDRQLADVGETLGALEVIAPKLDMYVVGKDGRNIVPSTGGARPPPEVPDDGQVHFVGEGATSLAVVHVPLNGPFASPARLIIARPLDDMEADLVRTRTQVALSVLASILASGSLLLIATRLLVEQPLARLVLAMRRMRENDAPKPLEPSRDDEVGDVLREFSTLARALQAAQDRLEHEQQTRLALERHLLRIDKLATVGQLSAEVAHEVGSPLQVLHGRLRRLERRVRGDASAAKTLEIALEQVERITRVVSQLLTFARPAPAMREVEPAQPARQVVELLDFEARRRGVTLEPDFERAPRRMLVDPDHIAQIVLNLLRNALQATTRGDRIVLRMGQQHDGEAAVMHLSVEDSGSGIAEEVQASVFEPFVTTRAGEGGTGLGLAVVRSLVHRYRGRVAVTSDPGSGTRFTVEIPIDPTPHDRQEEHDVPALQVPARRG